MQNASSFQWVWETWNSVLKPNLIACYLNPFDCRIKYMVCIQLLYSLALASLFGRWNVTRYRCYSHTMYNDRSLIYKANIAFRIGQLTSKWRKDNPNFENCLPIAMMNDDSGQIIDIVVQIGPSSFGYIIQNVLWHIQRFNWKFDAQIDFRAEKVIPTETFDVQT